MFERIRKFSIRNICDFWIGKKKIFFYSTLLFAYLFLIIWNKVSQKLKDLVFCWKDGRQVEKTEVFCRKQKTWQICTRYDRFRLTGYHGHSPFLPMLHNIIYLYLFFNISQQMFLKMVTNIAYLNAQFMLKIPHIITHQILF